MHRVRVMSPLQQFPPTNSPPYGPIDLLPQITSSHPIEFTVTFTHPSSGSDPITLGSSAAARLAWQQTEARPTISFSAEPAHEDATYTVLMTDPDAPTPHDTKYSYWRHWIQPGLRPSESSIAEKSQKAPLTEYLGPGKKDPLADPHRYLILLLREPSAEHPYHSLTTSDVGAEKFEARRAFDAPAWIKKYDLAPVALIWFWGSG
ncbi:phosphatidylethanolamine-binding protein [Gautieria morchelliformis]|nr:phosphatidylethanolamine-binding protein [Gautieria morchelliformis]